MKKFFFYLLLGGGSLLVIWVIISEILMLQVKTPAFEVLHEEKSIQLRAYQPLIVAEVTVHGTRREAIREGFRQLADYIFGDNTPKRKIPMTAPVSQQNIPMTRPVVQQAQTSHQTWFVRFIMPQEYTLETLPQPNNPNIRLVETPAKRYVAIRFSGYASQKNLNQNLSQLKTYLAASNLHPTGEPLFAFYDPPWTIPFLKHNEILFELKSQVD